MPKLERCPYCPISTRPTLLIMGRCEWHQHNPGNLVEIPLGADKEVNTAIKIDSGIKAATAKQAALLKKYYKLKEAFLNLNKYCLAKLPGCTVKADDLHHRGGRGANLLVVKKFYPVCRPCHQKITDMGEEAITRGFSEKRLTKET